MSEESPLDLIKRQRSHVLFVLSHPQEGHSAAFRAWYRGAFRQALLEVPSVLAAQCYEQHNVDITRGRYPRPAFQFLSLLDLSVDGAEAAADPIEQIARLHQEQATAQAPATWLYYPASECVGRSPQVQPSMLTLAFANGLPGQEAEFREWYATRHIRHALNIPALVSGQCFERTQFQRPGAREAMFHTIAVYEQAGTAESIIESFATLPPGTIDFPMLDRSRFAEWVYRPL